MISLVGYHDDAIYGVCVKELSGPGIFVITASSTRDSCPVTSCLLHFSSLAASHEDLCTPWCVCVWGGRGRGGGERLLVWMRGMSKLYLRNHLIFLPQDQFSSMSLLASMAVREGERFIH